MIIYFEGGNRKIQHVLGAEPKGEDPVQNHLPRRLFDVEERYIDNTDSNTNSNVNTDTNANTNTTILINKTLFETTYQGVCSTQKKGTITILILILILVLIIILILTLVVILILILIPILILILILMNKTLFKTTYKRSCAT